MGWAQCKGSPIFETEATTTCWICESYEKVTSVWCSEGTTVHQVVAPPGLYRSTLRPSTSFRTIGEASPLFRLRLTVSVKSASSVTIATWETKLCCVFGFPDHLPFNSSAPSTAKATQQWQQRYPMDLSCFLPSKGIWYHWWRYQPLQNLTQKLSDSTSLNSSWTICLT